MIYDRDCASCHGATGKGDGDDATYFTTKPTDLTDRAKLSKRTDEFLAAVITGGGPAKGLSKDMPATKNLSPDEVKSVVAYVLQLSGPAKGGKWRFSARGRRCPRRSNQTKRSALKFGVIETLKPP